MQHLREEQLVDLAEGARPDSAERHLAECERCRTQVAELRAVMAVAADVEVPEPSPLFWDHLSTRVRDAVANETAGAGESVGLSWLSNLWNWRVLAPSAAAAVLVIAAAFGAFGALGMFGTSGLRPSDSVGVVSPEVGSSIADATAGVDVAALLDDDPSLSLLADLAGELDWDDAAQAGLTTPAGSVDRVVLEMSAAERQELQRILREELQKS